MSYPAEVLNELAPQAREMLGIPQHLRFELCCNLA
jgi:hypothetical protein